MPDSPPAEVDDKSTIAVTDTPADAKPAESSQDAKPAESSAASSQAEPSMLDAVKTALKTSTEESPSSQAPGDKSAEEATQDPTAESKDDDSDELSEAELQSLHAKTRRRFQKLTQRLEAADAQIGALQKKAEGFDKLEEFRRSNGISDEMANGLWAFGKELQHDPRAALARITPVVQELRRLVGESDLPQGLRQRVDAGYLTEEDARAFMRASADATLNRQQLERAQEREREAQESKQLRDTTDATIGEVEKWEAAKAARDPDWHLKRQEIADQVELAINRKSRELGRPWFPTAAEAVELSEGVLKRINDRNKRLAPTPAEIRPVEGGASTRTTAEPKSLLDVVRQTVGAA